MAKLISSRARRPSGGKRAHRLLPSLLLLALSVSFAASSVLAQVGPTDVTATWSTISGNWNTPTEWACAPGPANCAPNNSASTVYETIVNSPGNMLTLDNSGGPITVNTLALQAGTLDVASGASLNLVNQPSGITDIPSAAGLIVAGTFTTGGSTNALANLGSVEGLLTLANGQTTSVTPGGGTLTNSGNVGVHRGSTLTVNGNFTNSGALGSGGAGLDGFNAINITGMLTGSGSIALSGGDDSLTSGSISTSGLVLNGPFESVIDKGDFSGAVSYNGTADSISVAGNFYSQGRVDLGGGPPGNRLTVAGNMNIAGGGVGPSSSISVGGDLTNRGSLSMIGFFAKEAFVDVGGAFNNAGALAISNFGVTVVSGLFTNEGTVDVNPGGRLNANGGFTNSGTVTVASATVVDAPGTILNAAGYSQVAGSTDVFGPLGAGSYSQSGGGTTIEFGGTILAGTFTVTGGNVQGGGTIVGNVQNTGGTVTPIDLGNPSTLTVNGNYTQGPNGILVIDLGGTGGGQFSVLSITGSAALDGTVEFMAVNGFTPGIGDSFTFLLASLGVSGTFADQPPMLTGFVCPAGATCTDVYGLTSVTFEINKSTTVTPEPGTLLLLGSGLLGMGALARKRKSVGAR